MDIKSMKTVELFKQKLSKESQAEFLGEVWYGLTVGVLAKILKECIVHYHNNIIMRAIKSELPPNMKLNSDTVERILKGLVFIIEESEKERELVLNKSREILKNLENLPDAK